MVIVGVVAVLTTASIANATKKARNAQCLTKMRKLGTAVPLYAMDNDGEFPRSNHSASRRRKIEWSVALIPYLGYASEFSEEEAIKVFNRDFRCPSDQSTNAYVWSYAMNVYFELDPTRDGYVGKPSSWGKSIQVERPSATILMGEAKGTAYGDHFMCHQWESMTAATNAVGATRHGKTSNYLFVDGHVESLPIEATFNPIKNLNRWNPSLAGNGM